MTVLLLLASAGVLFAYLNFGAAQRLLAPIVEIALPAGLTRLPAAEGDKFVVMTIDDAPSLRTDEILDLLARYDANATFFIHTDYISDECRVMAIRRMLEDGHELGHHMPKDTPSIELERPDFEREFSRAEEAMTVFRPANAPKYFRPAGGRFDNSVMDPSLKRFGYDETFAHLGGRRRYILAGFITWDAGGATNTPDREENTRQAEKYADQLAANLYPGAIVVFHDGDHDNREARLAATMISLERFLKSATDKGYEVVSISGGLQHASNAQK